MLPSTTRTSSFGGDNENLLVCFDVKLNQNNAKKDRRWEWEWEWERDGTASDGFATLTWNYSGELGPGLSGLALVGAQLKGEDVGEG